MQDKKTLKEYFNKAGFINKWGLYISYHPKAEISKNPLKRIYSKSLRKSLGYYFAGNMTTREQETYGKLFNINPRNITLYNSLINFLVVGSAAKFSENPELFLWWGLTNSPKIFFALKYNKGCQTFSPTAFFQNSTTYIKRLQKRWGKTISESRGIAESLGLIENWKGLENILE